MSAAMTWADELKAWRKNKRLTQAAAVEHLSRQTGTVINLYTYLTWEQSKHEPQPLVKAAIRQALKA